MENKAIVIDSDKEEIEKLTKKWENIKNIGEGLLMFGTSGLTVSLLSPFDFEGPVIEIVTAALAIGGFITKKIGESKLKELKANNISSWTENDRKEINNIVNTINSVSK